MYIGTAIMYISGYRADDGAKITNTTINKVFTKEDINEIKKIALDYGVNLKDSRSLSFRGHPTDFLILNARASILVMPRENNTILKITERKFWGIMLYMHVAKAGSLMNVFAVLVSISLIFVYLSGFIMTSWSKRFRAYTLPAFVLGWIIFTAVYLLAY